MADDHDVRVRGKRPPQGEPVIDRALVLLAFAPSGLQEEFLARPMYGEPDAMLLL
jgi:hypothetical protein